MQTVKDAMAVLALVAAVALPCTEARLEIIPPAGGAVITIDEILQVTRTTPPEDGVMGRLVVAQPKNACTPVQRPPEHKNESFAWFLLVEHLDCKDSIKLLNAHEAGYNGVIMYMPWDVPDFNLMRVPQVFIPNDRGIYAVIVAYQDGKFLLNCSYDKGFIIDWYPSRSMNLLNLLIPGIVIILFCILLIAGLMVVQQCTRWWRERRRNARHRLARKYLRQLPIKRFKKGEEFANYEVCSICLDEYQEGEKLRILPCQHGYHAKCIDTWLTKNRRVCPLCKRRVVLPGMVEDLSDDETTPLLGPTSDSSGGTFARREVPNRAQIQAALASSLLRPSVQVHVEPFPEPQASSSAPATAPAGAYSLNDEFDVVRPRRSRRHPRRRSSRRPREPFDDLNVAGPSTPAEDQQHPRRPQEALPAVRTRAATTLVSENQMLCVTEMGSEDEQPLVV